MLRSVSILAASLILTSVAFAHEGHGDPTHQHGATHYAVNPSHAVPIIVTVTGVIGLGLLVRRSVRNGRA
jgi:glutathione S-transferase